MHIMYMCVCPILLTVYMLYTHTHTCYDAAYVCIYINAAFPPTAAPPATSFSHGIVLLYLSYIYYM